VDRSERGDAGQAGGSAADGRAEALDRNDRADLLLDLVGDAERDRPSELLKITTASAG
jgi:hypothetical protein